MRARGSTIAAGLALLLAAPAALAASAPDAGRPFEPPPLPPARFAVKPPSADPSQVRIVRAADGTELYTETWLPAARGDEVPPAELPVVIQLSPYSRRGAPESAQRMELLVSRGYAYTQAHVRGSGGSGGCIEQTAANEVSDGARIVEDAGERAPWSSGVVGTYGISYRGATQLATATGPDRDRLETLRAIVVGAPVASAYDFFHHDGVPHALQAEANVAAYALYLSSPHESPERLPERPGCQPGVLLGAASLSGDYTPHYAERDHSRHLDRLEAATLMWHGHNDTRVSAQTQIGLFDAIPAGVPKHGLFGVFDHEHPDSFRSNTAAPRSDWVRDDWNAMTVAWYERHLRGVDNGVDDWPVAQVQGTDGQWRTAADWPRAPGGTAARLLLGADGELGAGAPRGSTSYVETAYPELTLDGSEYPPGTAAVFTTAPLEGRLELYGAPELDAWIELDRPDAHLAARLEALDASGRPAIAEARVVGARSMRHLEPFEDGRFRQASGSPPPVGTPVRVAVRFGPTDLVVPRGGRLRLTVAGSVQGFDGLDGVQEGLGAIVQGPTLPSLASPTVRILHSCDHPSALRFTLPGPESELIDVREADERGEPLGDDPPAPPPAVDGGGLTTRPACS